MVAEVVNIDKGEKIDLNKQSPGMTHAHCGVRWKLNTSVSKKYPFDLDFFFVELDENGQAVYGSSKKSIVFHKNPQNDNKSVYVAGDNLEGGTGKSGLFNEEGYIDFPKVPEEVKQVMACVSIHEYKTRAQNFGQIDAAFCEILNDVDAPLIKFDLTEDASSSTGIIIGRFKRELDRNWSFKRVGEAFKDGMPGILRTFGIQTKGGE